MSFTEICWLIVKICAGVVGFFLILGFTAKKIGEKRNLDRLNKEIDSNND